MATRITTNILRPPKAPNIPIAPVSYDQRYTDQFLNALRLYFNQIDNFAQPFSNNNGGGYLRFPNGAFHQDGVTNLTGNMTNNSTTPIQVTSTVQFATSGHILIGTELIAYTGKTSTTFTGITRGVYGTTNVSHTSGAYVTEALGLASPTSSRGVPFDTTDASNNVAIDPVDDTKIVISTPGYYNIQFSAQLLNFTSADDNVTFWFKNQDGDVAYSAGIANVPQKHGSGINAAGANIVSWNIVLPFNAGDFFQLFFASESGDTVCATYPPGTAPVHPVSPSVILTATFVSALY